MKSGTAFLIKERILVFMRRYKIIVFLIFDIFIKMGKKSKGNLKSVGHYLVGKTIGKGTFGKVKLGLEEYTNEKVAIKILEKDKISDNGDVERVTREIHILKKIRYPNIVQLYEIIETSYAIYLIMEYVNGGELFDYIVKNKRLNEKEAARVL